MEPGPRSHDRHLALEIDEPPAPSERSLQKPEPCARKPARTVLRGERRSNAPLLPDSCLRRASRSAHGPFPPPFRQPRRLRRKHGRAASAVCGPRQRSQPVRAETFPRAQGKRGAAPGAQRLERDCRLLASGRDARQHLTQAAKPAGITPPGRPACANHGR